jgi:WD40 repeat protein
MRRPAFLLICICLSFSISLVNAQEKIDCKGSMPTRLSVGQPARVTDAYPSWIYSAASWDADEIERIESGEIIDIIDGPVCERLYTWWKVDYEGVVGWITEAFMMYSLEPINTSPQPDPILENDAIRIFTPENSFVGDRSAVLTDRRQTDFTLSSTSPLLAIRGFSTMWFYRTDDPATAPTVFYVSDPDLQLHVVAFSANGDLIAFSAFDDTQNQSYVWIIDAATMSVVERIERTRDSAVFSMIFTEEDQQLWLADGDLTIWDIRKREIVSAIAGAGDGNLHISPIKPYLVTTGRSSANIWNLETGTQVKHFFAPDVQGNPNFGYSTLSPNGRILIATYGKEIFLYNAVSGASLREITKPNQTAEESYNFEISGLAFSKDGRQVISGGDKLRIWNVTLEKRNLVAELSSPSGFGHSSISLSSDGTQIIWNGTSSAEMWDFDTLSWTASVIGFFSGFTFEGNIVTSTFEAVYLWDRSGELITTLHPRYVEPVSD